VAEKKPFLLRMDRELLDAVQRWANDDLRSLNGQIEFVLRRALSDSGRALSDSGRTLSDHGRAVNGDEKKRPARRSDPNER
jgi:hypothetical protein